MVDGLVKRPFIVRRTFRLNCMRVDLQMGPRRRDGSALRPNSLYYAFLFLVLTHSKEHPSRLNRFDLPRGSKGRKTCF